MRSIRLHLTAWIWLVASLDVWCCQFLTADQELNPLARIILVQGGVWLMVACKVFGTFLVTEWLRRLPLYFTIILALVQLGLVLVLAEVIPI